MKNTALILLLMVSINLFSQKVTIKGISENGFGKKIELITYTDYLTYNEQKLAETTIDTTSGKFDMIFQISYPRIVFVAIENYTYEFIVEPNRTYEIYIPTFDWEIDEKINVFYNPQAIPLYFKDMPSDDLNILIASFDSLCYDNITKYRYWLDFRRSRTHFDTIEQNIEKMFGKTTNPYFNDYKKYKIAELKYNYKMIGKSTVERKYFTNKPTLLENIAYVSLFRNVYDHYFIEGTEKTTIDGIEIMIEDMDYHALMDSLKLLRPLKDDAFRELVIIRGLENAYKQKKFYKQSVLGILKKITEETLSVQNKTLAQNYINKFSKETTNYYPNFTLPDIDKREISLSDFKGKWVYLSFVRVNEAVSQREIETMLYYYDSLSTHYNIEFLTINCNREYQKLYHFLKNSKRGDNYKWKWLYLNNDFKLLNDFKVKSYPTFVLINPEGRVVSLPAPSPGDGFFVNPTWLTGEKEVKKEDTIIPF